MRRHLSAAVLVGVLGSGSVLAHHSFATYYFEERSVSIEGELIEFVYAAPHAWVYLNAPDSDGTRQRFAAEWANPTRLVRDGITKDTLKAGDHIIITGSPGREASEHKIHLKSIERPADGWRWRQAARRR